MALANPGFKQNATLDKPRLKEKKSQTADGCKKISPRQPKVDRKSALDKPRLKKIISKQPKVERKSAVDSPRLKGNQP